MKVATTKGTQDLNQPSHLTNPEFNSAADHLIEVIRQYHARIEDAGKFTKEHVLKEATQILESRL